MSDSNATCPPIISQHWIPKKEQATIPEVTRKMVAGHNMYTATKDSRDIEAGAAKTYPE